MKTSLIVDWLLDGLLWVTATGFTVSFFSSLIKNPVGSFFTGFALAVFVLFSAFIADKLPVYKPLIYSRLIQVILGFLVGIGL